MDLGLEVAGFDVIGCIEWDETARRSLKANRDGIWELHEIKDIEVAAAALKPEHFELSVSELDLLCGAPPCQPYSKAAQWVPGTRRGLDDSRGRYLDDYLKLLETFLPKVAVIENVRGFVRGATSALEHLDLVLERIEAATGVRYERKHRILDASDHGVPQTRHRAIVILTRLERPITWPSPCDRRTAWDAIGLEQFDDELPQMNGKWAGLLPSIPEGENYLWHTNRGGGEPLFGYRTRYWSFLLKLAKDQPSWTLPAQPGPATGPFHWDNRPLRIQEMLRLQTFPRTWQVEGASRVEQVKQIGNATPPLLAEVIGRSLVAHINDADVDDSPLQLQLPRRCPVPQPNPIKPVPDEYRSLARMHPDHPGPGRGPGARRSSAPG